MDESVRACMFCVFMGDGFWLDFLKAKREKRTDTRRGLFCKRTRAMVMERREITNKLFVESFLFSLSLQVGLFFSFKCSARERESGLLLIGTLSFAKGNNIRKMAFFFSVFPF